MSSDDNTELHLTGLPSAVLLVGMCSFLPLEDIFVLRLTSSKVLALLHGEGQDELWKLVLQRDFCFTDKNLKGGPIDTLIYRGPGDEALSPSRNMIEPATSHFDALKKWMKVSAWFYQGWKQGIHSEIQSSIQRGEEVAAPAKAIALGRQPHVHGPFFLRAARFWENLVRWCEDGPRVPCKDGSLGSQEEARIRRVLQRTLSPHGIQYVLFGDPCRDKAGLLARLAISAFSSGTTILSSLDPVVVDGVSCGILGGYEAYGHFRINGLFSLFQGKERYVSLNLLSYVHGMPASRGCVAVEPKTGRLYVHGFEDCKPLRVGNETSKGDDLLLWLEEYLRRLVEGEIGIGALGTGPSYPKGITLFPRYVPGATPKLTNGVPVVSRKVTRGVEVIASAIIDATRQSDMGFIYSIRIRLMTPDDGDEYLSPDERGFFMCQLRERHWRIVNDETGTTQIVDGDGVIGMTPVLKEYGYLCDGEDFSGTFQYQSCTGPMKKGTFGGHLTFDANPGNGAASASFFDVEVGTFVLDSEPDYLY
jgi:uncharacterized protein affecting Mg2+/Co2+ transport